MTEKFWSWEKKKKASAKACTKSRMLVYRLGTDHLSSSNARDGLRACQEVAQSHQDTRVAMKMTNVCWAALVRAKQAAWAKCLLVGTCSVWGKADGHGFLQTVEEDLVDAVAVLFYPMGVRWRCLVKPTPLGLCSEMMRGSKRNYDWRCSKRNEVLT